MKKVLIIHGWMHSAERYKLLGKELNNCEVFLYEFPGFGDTGKLQSKSLLDTLSEKLKQYIKDNKFDCIISHSMGCNVVIKAVKLLKEMIFDNSRVIKKRILKIYG